MDQLEKNETQNGGGYRIVAEPERSEQDDADEGGSNIVQKHGLGSRRRPGEQAPPGLVQAVYTVDSPPQTQNDGENGGGSISPQMMIVVPSEL
ncbi:hypothetical protein PG988_005929 [Apiospora saccharicola]